MHLTNLSSWDITLIIAALSHSQKNCGTDEVKEDIRNLKHRIREQAYPSEFGEG